MRWLRGRPWWQWLILVFAVGTAAQAVVMALGGGSFDPTDPYNFDHFRLASDTGNHATVSACDQPGCGVGNLLGSGDLEPGVTVDVTVPWGSKAHATFVVAFEGGATRCVDLDARKRFDGQATTALSSAAPCPG